jgi:hypothetical protein
VVSKKKKPVLVQELRDRKYEAFPPKADTDKTKEPSDPDNEDAEDDDTSGGARDYDYLLSVRSFASITPARIRANEKLDAHLVSDHGAPGEAEEPDCSEESRAR